MGRPVAHPAPPVAHALHDDNIDVIDEDVAEGVHSGLLAEATTKLEPTLSLGCRWRVPLTRVRNSFGVLLLYRDQLDAQTLD